MNARRHSSLAPPWARAWSVILGVLCLGGLALSTRAGTQVASGGLQALDSPEKVFTASCSACHGHDGTGQPAEQVGFDVGFPDFTDCSFATREPNKDWRAVATLGGPARGFDHRMPAFGEALSPQQIAMAVEHLRSFCPEPDWPRGDLNKARAMVTEKAFVEDEVVFTFGSSVQEPYELEAELTYETRFGSRSQFELIVPFVAAKQEPSDEDPEAGGWVGGLADVAVGLKHVFAYSMPAGFIISGMGELVLPTGKEEDGLGSGALKFEPGLAIGQTLGPVGFLHLQVGAEIPIERDSEMEGFWRAVYGYTFVEGAFGRAWTPMVEVLGWMELQGGADPHWDVVPQFQVSLSTRQHISLNLAARIPVEPGNDRPIGLFAYLLWEWFDGGFGEGW